MSEQPIFLAPPETPAGSAGVTDDQASALLADAVAAADKTNATEHLTPEQRMAELPGWARNEINQLRSSKESKQQAAEQARTEIAQTVGKALGFVKDDEPVDPTKLTEQLTAAGADARQAKIELAVFRASQATDADPSALLDSTSFLAKLKDIDPTDSAAVTAAITSAVASNPRLGAAPGTPRPPAPNPAQGSSASGSGAPDFKKQIADAMKAGDIGLSIALEEQRAASLKTKS